MLHRFSAAWIVALATVGLACSAPTNVEPVTGSDEIVSVPQTDLERRSIGGSWLYAHATWIASMHEAATGERLAISEAYWAYFFFFDQIAYGHVSSIATGGNWATANRIVAKYGLVTEDAFASADTTIDASTRWANAVTAIDASLASGALADPAARQDRARVRRELDRAWNLSPAAVSMLDRVFGDGVSRSLSSRSEPATTDGSPIVRADALDVAYAPAPSTAPRTRKLSNAMTDWKQAYYSGSERRAFLERIQRALHDRQAVVLTWFVDFDALETRAGALRGAFALATLRELGPGVQGGDTAVISGYDARLADGRIVSADRAYDPKNPDDKALLDAALLPSTDVTSLRVKDAWGASRPPRTGIDGIMKHDLHLDYLDGPVARCVVRDGATDTKDCPYQQIPLQDVVLPPGY